MIAAPSVITQFRWPCLLPDRIPQGRSTRPVLDTHYPVNQPRPAEIERGFGETGQEFLVLGVTNATPIYKRARWLLPFLPASFFAVEEWRLGASKNIFLGQAAGVMVEAAFARPGLPACSETPPPPQRQTPDWCRHRFENGERRSSIAMKGAGTYREDLVAPHPSVHPCGEGLAPLESFVPLSFHDVCNGVPAKFPLTQSFLRRIGPRPGMRKFYKNRPAKITLPHLPTVLTNQNEEHGPR